MAKKMPTASTDVSTLPRRSDFAEGAGGDDEWCREIEKKSDNYSKACRANTTSDEFLTHELQINEALLLGGVQDGIGGAGQGGPDHPHLGG